ncbi:NAD(P)/FAD-dependent oxidoreductase [Chryseobacterium sp. CKR4-1]|uniref:FAD-dependent oxidoreductase n=1 Tax=Chryseobacterium sp. CKR4-1 TaxID=3068896 RepID=UPI002796893E|nr:NAD(P)/FAD-dependent oxidoreductase [Chryseobacterium sp. CKR4-1]MDQ1806240.1 NAD(P)/FAD-dependent oxidoreductase [Chryseobacterium sp. CKR4-1]
MDTINRIPVQKQIRIAIAGAGLGGLCLAQGLKKKGIQCVLFEKDEAMNTRTQGYRIRINEQGRQALEDCLPESLYQLFMETCAARTKGLKVFTSHLEKTGKDLVDSWSDGIREVPDLKPNRLTLREILVHGLEEKIHFGKAVTDYRRLESGEVLLSFADGSTYTADLVIAADGVNSRIGTECCGDQKVNTGNITIYGRTFLTDENREAIAAELRTGTSVILGDQFSLIADAMQFDFSKHNSSWDALSPLQDYFYWAFIGKPAAFGWPLQDFYTLSSQEIFNHIRRVTDNWHPQLKALLDFGDQQSLVMGPIRSSLPKEKWVSGNITALGDAVHAMSPAGGVGANTAFRDAALLTANISEAVFGNTELALAIENYEDAMRIYSNEAIIMSLEGGEVLYGNPVNGE